MLQQLGPYAIECTQGDLDYQAVWAGIGQGGDRAGLLAAGSIEAALQASAALTGRGSFAQLLQDPQALDLMRFSVGEDHITLRRALAIAE
jgi:hypothetical protein